MGQSTKMSNTGLQQQGSVGNGAPPAMVPAAGSASSVTVGSGNGPKKARSGYNAKAMAEIRNSLRPYEDSNPTNVQLNMANLVGMQTGSITVNTGPSGVRPVSSLSTGSSSNSNYSDCIQSLMNLGFDEVRNVFQSKLFEVTNFRYSILIQFKILISLAFIFLHMPRTMGMLVVLRSELRLVCGLL